VAGIGQAPPSSSAAWSTYVRDDDVARALGSAERAGGTRLAGPFEAGADGRLAVLTDATGVPFCLWQAGSRVGAELVGEPGAWAMSSLHTSDLQRAEAFYGEMFGWELEPVSGAPFAQWRLDGEVVAVATPTEGTAVPPHWSVNFAVRDADEVAEHAAALGATVLMAPFDTPGFRNAVIADPQGGVIAISAAAA
jgi:predicted enzyme related to lactoylglutathione lyase